MPECKTKQWDVCSFSCLTFSVVKMRAKGLPPSRTRSGVGWNPLLDLIQNGYDICTVQELLGHKDVRTTMIYTHVLRRGGLAIRSPLDA